MEMTRLHKQFVLIFVAANSQPESGRTSAERPLTLTSQYTVIKNQIFSFTGITKHLGETVNISFCSQYLHKKH